MAAWFDAWLIEPISPRDLDFLSLDERTSSARFARKQDRDSFLSTRLALRCLLADAMHVHPRELCFRRNPWGKLQLDQADHPAELDFNVSHTEGLAAIALSRGARIGIDIELQRAVPDCSRIAADVFCEDAAARLAGLREPEQDTTFLRLWTAAEALVKAAGTGLGGFEMPVPVAMSADDNARIYVKGSFADGAWNLISLDLPTGFVGSIAVEGSLPRPTTIVPKRIDHAQLTSRNMH